MLQDNAQSLEEPLKAAREEREKRSPFWRSFRNEFIGPRWRSGLGVKRVSNYIYTYSTTMLQMLFYRDPYLGMKGKGGPEGQVIAEIFEQALNDVKKRQHFEQVAQQAIFNSFYAFGFVKTGVTGDEYNSNNLLPFAESVSPFRAIWDDTAKSVHMTQFLGDEFLVDLDNLLNDPRYTIDPAMIDSIWTTRKGKVDDAAEDKTAGEDRDEFVQHMPPRAMLSQLYLRHIGRIVTLVRTGMDSHEVIASAPYNGPPGGGYHMLGYIYPDNSVLPVAPGAAWWEQWRELEEQERDLLQQVKNYKKVVVFKSGGADSAKIIKEARTSSVVTGVSDPGEEREYGGASDQKLLAVSDARIRFEKASGLSEVKQGSAPQGTATSITLQDRYSNIGVEGMQGKIANFCIEIMDDWKWYMWTDENVQTSFNYTDKPTGQVIPMTMQGGNAEAEGISPIDLQIEIDPSSFTRQNGPLDRQNAIQELSLLIGPVAQIAAIQGFMVSMPDVLHYYGQKLGSDMSRFLVPMSPIAQQMLMMTMQKTQGVEQSVPQIEQLKLPALSSGGGGQRDGQMMSDVMSGSPTMQAAGTVAAPLGIAQRG